MNLLQVAGPIINLLFNSKINGTCFIMTGIILHDLIKQDQSGLTAFSSLLMALLKKVIPTLRGVGLTDAAKEIQIDRFSSKSDDGVSVDFIDTTNRFMG